MKETFTFVFLALLMRGEGIEGVLPKRALLVYSGFIYINIIAHYS